MQPVEQAQQKLGEHIGENVQQQFGEVAVHEGTPCIFSGGFLRYPKIDDTGKPFAAFLSKFIGTTNTP